MSGAADQAIHDVLATSVTALVVVLALWGLVRVLERPRPGLSIGIAVGAAFAVRMLVVAGIDAIDAGYLRGPDEGNFLADATAIAASGVGSDPWLSALTGELHEFVLAVQVFLLDSPEVALRAVHIAIAVAGLALLATAVYELAGARAALITAWLLALEPTNVFYSEVLHKEAGMLLAAGLVALGGATLWRRGELSSLVPILAGCAIAIATRPYAGWFLVGAGAAITLHTALRLRRRAELEFRALAMISGVVMVAALATPTVLSVSSPGLDRLQLRQDFTATQEGTNLALEPVNFTTPQGIATGLPRRIRDVALRPYPWQIANTKQRLGVIGTTVVIFLICWLAAELYRNRRHILDRAAPLVYVGAFLLLCYSLSAANAGTAFRYRTQLVAIGIALLVTLIYARRRAASSVPELAEQPADLVLDREHALAR